MIFVIRRRTLEPMPSRRPGQKRIAERYRLPATGAPLPESGFSAIPARRHRLKGSAPDDENHPLQAWIGI